MRVTAEPEPSGEPGPVAGRRGRSMTRGKIVADLAAALALGGDCLADIAVLREQPALAGQVNVDPGAAACNHGAARCD